MDTVVLVLMLLIAFNFLLKQTFWKTVAVGIIATVAALFAGLMWPYAIEQSKTQIADWLGNTALMLDTSVLLTIEVSLQMAYAMLAVHVASALSGKTAYTAHLPLPEMVSGTAHLSGTIQRAGLSYLCLPRDTIHHRGMDVCRLRADSHSRRTLATALPPSGERSCGWNSSSSTNALVAILGIVATVNGRTSVAGVSEVNWGALAGVRWK